MNDDAATAPDADDALPWNSIDQSVRSMSIDVDGIIAQGIIVRRPASGGRPRWFAYGFPIRRGFRSRLEDRHLVVGNLSHRKDAVLALRDYLVSAASQEWEEIPRRREAVRIGRATLTAQMKQQVLERDNYRCQLCGWTNPEELTVDHIVALSDGGSNDELNLRALCRPCNSAKRDHAQISESRGSGPHIPPLRWIWYRWDGWPQRGRRDRSQTLTTDQVRDEIRQLVADWNEFHPEQPLDVAEYLDAFELDVRGPFPRSGFWLGWMGTRRQRGLPDEPGSGDE